MRLAPSLQDRARLKAKRTTQILIPRGSTGWTGFRSSSCKSSSRVCRTNISSEMFILVVSAVYRTLFVQLVSLPKVGVMNSQRDVCAGNWVQDVYARRSCGSENSAFRDCITFCAAVTAEPGHLVHKRCVDCFAVDSKPLAWAAWTCRSLRFMQLNATWLLIVEMSDVHAKSVES